MPATSFRTLIAALSLLLAAGAHAQSGEERLARFLDGMQTLRADFVQQVFDENLTRVDESQGTLSLSRPDRFRFEYFPPAPTLIVADGSKVWIYDPELKQVTVQALDEAIGNTPAVLLSSGKPLAEDFELRELGEVSGLHWVGLKPRSPDATFTDIRLGFDDVTLRMMEMADTFGQVTQLRFARLDRNPSINDALFRFTPPPGVDVLGEEAPAAASGG